MLIQQAGLMDPLDVTRAVGVDYEEPDHEDGWSAGRVTRYSTGLARVAGCLRSQNVRSFHVRPTYSDGTILHNREARETFRCALNE